MASLIKIDCKIDSHVLHEHIMELRRGFYKVKRKAVRRTLRAVVKESREILRQNKLRSRVPQSGTYYGRTYGRLTASIKSNESTGTVSAGGNGIAHAYIEDDEDFRAIYPVNAPRLKFIWWRLSAGTQLVKRYNVKKTRLVVSQGPIFRKGSGYLSRPWRENIENLPTVVEDLARQEGII
jgi:hypothetical protein